MAHLGEIKIFAFNFVPTNYVLCDGRRLKKSEYATLYRILGDIFTQHTSDESTFGIPDLRHRFVKHPETDIRLGEQKGVDKLTLTSAQMPEHNHDVSLEVDNTTGGDEVSPSPNATYLNNNAAVFSTDLSENAFLGGVSQQNVGNSKPIPIKNEHVKMVYAIRYKNDDPQDGFLGEIKIWPSSKTVGVGAIPKGWKLCNGDTYSISNNSALGSIIGFKYGESSDGKPKLPDFRNKFATGAQEINKVAETGGNTSIRLGLNSLPTHKHDVKLAVNNDVESDEVQVPTNAFINKNAGTFSQAITSQASLGGVSQENRGSNQELDITNSCLGLNYIICVKGIIDVKPENAYIGEIILYAGVNNAYIETSDLTQCHGQLMHISQNQKLFSLLSNLYGGDGTVNFKLPDLRNKLPLCVSAFDEVGKTAGANSIKLTQENLPEHNHDVKLAVNPVDSGTKVAIPNGILNKNAGRYSTKETENTYLAGIIEHDFTREAEAVNLRNPFLSINYLICLKGNYPSKKSKQ